MGFFDFMYAGGTPRITVAEARTRQAAGEPLIDIREIYEWNRGHAAGAVHIPMARLAGSLDNYDKAQEIMLICASGNRSLTAAQRLIELGYKAVSVHGGTTAWKSAGYPMET
ncbi:MAG: rhodanese-like domain-containing protein [Actinomycetaceae bacterium]|nr:hypothetical protein [Arcanobacterium sp.]MDD7505316.1 rhodanese-like domain-containing protein [Actinomycetaceae bacterium]MDY6142953.1 rhodanese-like domain-containing protein [Arcanobacterium sp.]